MTFQDQLREYVRLAFDHEAQFKKLALLDSDESLVGVYMSGDYAKIEYYNRTDDEQYDTHIPTGKFIDWCEEIKKEG